MKLIKISSAKSDEFIMVPSSDMQDVMFAIERIFQERRTPRLTGERPKLKDDLLFDVYGTSKFKGYCTEGEAEDFTAEVIHYRSYDCEQCRLM